ncbi:MAG: hypothetical protein ACOYOJ_18590, partial [Alsobacter sp.]
MAKNGGWGIGGGHWPAAGATMPLAEQVLAPSDALVFHGHYARAGNDLVITSDFGARFVAEDYFAGHRRATLVSPNGATLDGDVVAALAGATRPLTYAQATPLAPNQIGRVETVSGTATAIRNGQPVVLNVG